MFSLNRAQIVGNMTRDPEMKYIPSGQAVANFAIATNRRWKDKDGNPQEQTEFHEIVAWGKLAELCSQLFHKGNKVYVEGRIQTRNWEGQDGNKRYTTEIVADTVSATGQPKAVGENAAIDNTQNEMAKDTSKKEDVAKNQKQTSTGDKNEEIDLDDIPF